MKKIGLILALFTLCCSLTACAKKINGQKAYKVNVTNTSKASGKRSELIKIKGTTSAPDGYEVVAVKSDGKDRPVCNNNNMRNYVQVRNGKFTGYIDPLQYSSKVEKGNILRYHFATVKDVKKLDNRDKKDIKKKFDSSSVKLSFDPVTEFVQSNVKKSLGSGAIISKKSKTVFTITPKKDSDFENDISESMYGDKNKWSEITKKINKLSKQLKTPAGRIALVLINPENHKKFLLVSIGGKAKVDSISSGTVNSSTNNASNMKLSSVTSNSTKDSDGDDFDLGLILGYLLAYDEEYGDDAEDDNSSDNTSYDDDSNYNEDNYDNDDDYYDDSDDYNNNSSQSDQSNNDEPANQTSTNAAFDY